VPRRARTSLPGRTWSELTTNAYGRSRRTAPDELKVTNEEKQTVTSCSYARGDECKHTRFGRVQLVVRGKMCFVSEEPLLYARSVNAWRRWTCFLIFHTIRCQRRTENARKHLRYELFEENLFFFFFYEKKWIGKIIKFIHLSSYSYGLYQLIFLSDSGLRQLIPYYFLLISFWAFWRSFFCANFAPIRLLSTHFGSSEHVPPIVIFSFASRLLRLNFEQWPLALYFPYFFTVR